MYVTPKKALQYYSVSKDTLRRWDKKGQIKTIRTDGGHRRYYIPSDKPNPSKKSYIYARVSSSKQKPDLQNQIKFLQEKYPKHNLVTDVGSGLNFERKGFNTILDTYDKYVIYITYSSSALEYYHVLNDRLFKGLVGEVVVASKDRFARFGFDLFTSIFTKFDAQLISIDANTDKSPQEELAEDLLAITTVFSARIHGRRKYSKSNKKNKNLSK